MKMNWMIAGLFSLIGIPAALIVTLFLLSAGDCGIGAGATGIFFGFSFGSVGGITLYRNLFLKRLDKADLIGAPLGFVLSALGAMAGLYCMDSFGSSKGLIFAVCLPCLGALLGYYLSTRITVSSKALSRRGGK